MSKSNSQVWIERLLESDRLPQLDHEGRRWYAAVDVVAAVSETEDPAQLWDDLKAREPALAGLAERLDLAQPGDEPAVTDMLDAIGVLRLIQSVPSPRAERLKRWLAERGQQWLEEDQNPELAMLRARKLYEHKGYNRRWIDKRLRGISARQELTGEWFKRGAVESDEFRALTNQLMSSAFGMDVESYRRYKGLRQPSQNLRDHMSDLELVLTLLGETTATLLHRERNSRGFEQLQADTKDAGEIASRTLEDVTKRLPKRPTRKRVA